jgi:tetratricopeptide (TPR) repeat protein
MNVSTRLAIPAVLLLSAALVAPPLAADFNQALNSFKAGRYVEAAAEFQTLVDQSPNYDFGWFMLGNCFLKMNKLADAEKNLKKAIELKGDNFNYHNSLAAAYLGQRKFADTVRTLDTAEGLLPNDSTAKFAFFSQRGTANSALQRWDDAVRDLERAAAIRKDPAVYSQLGTVHFNRGDNTKAAQAFQEATRLDPNSPPEIYRLLAEALLNEGARAGDPNRKRNAYLEAMRAAEKLRSLRPADHAAVDLVGQAALGAGDFRTAEDSFARVLQMKPDHCLAMMNLARAHIARDQWKDAERHLLGAATCSPRDNQVYLNLGFVYLKQDRLNESLAAYEKSDEIRSSSAAKQGITTVRDRIETNRHNKELEEKERQMMAAAEAERQRIEEEKRKRELWERRRQDQ